MKKILRSPGFQRFRQQAGMALVVTLSLIVLVTIAVMAFFARATANRAVESSRANQVLAAQLSETAQDYVAGQFLQEMAMNSTNNYPTTSAFIVPQSPLLSAMSGFTNLVRRSVNETTNGVGETNASAHAAAAPSRNGRLIAMDRWNAPLLLAGGGFTTSNQLPNWIYVNRDGTMASTPSTNAIGRFAYNAYNIGGLLDANIAGYPSPVSAGTTSLAILKGAVAGADLSVIPGIGSTNNMSAFVGWRSTNSAGSATAYLAAETNAATNGFLRAPAGDQRIPTRQDLIKIARTGNYGISTNALPYLTHFSRRVSAPSWGPTTNGTGSAYQYKTDADNSSSINRNIANVRVTSPFPRRDGTTAKVGEPLLSAPFALSRLSGLGVNGPVSPATPLTIQQDFGLVWQNNRWEYCGPTGNSVQASIAVIGSIGNREPNFFELLKAGILSGSLGQGPADNNGTIGMNWHPAYSKSLNNAARGARLADYQIVQIAANIIDQYDADDIPTAILFDSALPSGPFLGTENLPYVSKLYTRMFRPSSGYGVGMTQPSYRPWVRGWLAIEMWNPHGNASAAVSKNMRIVQTAGSMQVFTKDRRNASGGTIPPSSPYTGGTRFSIPAATVTGNQTLSFTAGPGFASPSVLSSSAGGASNSQAEGNLVDSGLSWSGFWLGDINEPDSTLAGTLTALALLTTPLTVNDVTAKSHYGFGPCFDSNVILELQVDAGGGAWRTVQRLHQPNHQSGGQSFYYFDWQSRDLTETDRNVITIGSHGLTFSDPRTQRFGMGILSTNYKTLISDTPWDNKALRQGINPFGSGRFLRVSGCVPYVSTGSGTWVDPETPASPTWHFADLCENLSASTCRAPDPDGVLRPGDGRLATAAGYDAQGATAASPATNPRPVILNRPFLNVGEIGYAFRDQPWKTLDFFSTDTADVGLLDIFCLVDSVPVTAGAVNLNSAPQEVLQAIISGADRETTAGASIFSQAQASDLAHSLRAQIFANPLLSVGEIAQRTASLSTVSDFGTAADASIKSRREASLRALAACGQTRTWNLLCDIIVQSGRFAGSGTTAADFVVEGEARVWQSIALDRFTGRIVDKQTEPVSE
jgi:hypothetical protein